MKRREFITLLGGAAVAWPFAVSAQTAGKQPTIGYIGGGGPITQRAWVEAFVQRLRELGSIEGRTIAIEYRWGRDAPSPMPSSRPSLSGLRKIHSRRRNRSSGRGKAGDITHPDRLPDGGRPGRQSLGRFAGATGRQRHRTVDQGSDLPAKRLGLLREVFRL